jgi:hypothetical protein
MSQELAARQQRLARMTAAAADPVGAADPKLAAQRAALMRALAAASVKVRQPVVFRIGKGAIR